MKPKPKPAPFRFDAAVWHKGDPPTTAPAPLSVTAMLYERLQTEGWAELPIMVARRLQQWASQKRGENPIRYKRLTDETYAVWIVKK